MNRAAYKRMNDSATRGSSSPNNSRRVKTSSPLKIRFREELTPEINQLQVTKAQKKFLFQSFISSYIRPLIEPLMVTMDSATRLAVDIFLFFYSMSQSVYRIFFPRQEKSVKDQVVLITGAANGLGRSMAFQFVRRGAKVVLWDIDSESLSQTTQMLQHASPSKNTTSVYPYTVDVTDPNAVKTIAESVRREVGNVNILINNAGVVSGKKFLDLTEDDINRTVRVNLLSNFWTIRQFLPDMIKSKAGHIVTVSSVAGHLGVVRLTDYCSSKYATVGLSDSLRFELRHDESTENIHVTEVSPYFFDSNMFSGANPGVHRFLSLDYVAESAVSGILRNQTRIMVPFFMGFLIGLKVLLPFESSYWLARALGETDSMVHFRGSKTQGPDPTKPTAPTDEMNNNKPVDTSDNNNTNHVEEVSTDASSHDTNPPHPDVSNESAVVPPEVTLTEATPVPTPETASTASGSGSESSR